MGSIASELKLEREKRNVSLAQIAENTNISLRHLQSIEDGRFCDLPGGMYNRAFLRAYCASLDLNQKELLQKYEREYSSTSDKTVKHKLQANKPVLSLRPGPVVLWSFIVLIFIAGIFIGRTYIAEIFSPYISDTSASRQENPQPVHPIAGPPAAAVDPGSPALFKSTSPEETGIHSDGAPYPFPASAAGLGPAAGDVSIISPFQALHLEIIGKEQCWISITHDGDRVITEMIEPGQTRSFNAKERMDIIIGNAGGINMNINGKPAKPLGNPGQVLRLTITEKTLPDILLSSTG